MNSHGCYSARSALSKLLLLCAGVARQRKQNGARRDASQVPPLSWNKRLGGSGAQPLKRCNDHKCPSAAKLVVHRRTNLLLRYLRHSHKFGKQANRASISSPVANPSSPFGAP